MLQDNLEDISDLVKKGLAETLDFIINADIDLKLENSSPLQEQLRMAERKQYLISACTNTQQLMNGNTVCIISHSLITHSKVVRILEYIYIVI